MADWRVHYRPWVYLCFDGEFMADEQADRRRMLRLVMLAVLASLCDWWPYNSVYGMAIPLLIPADER